jgi:hypothetical protein
MLLLNSIHDVKDYGKDGHKKSELGNVLTIVGKISDS